MTTDKIIRQYDMMNIKDENVPGFPDRIPSHCGINFGIEAALTGDFAEITRAIMAAANEHESTDPLSRISALITEFSLAYCLVTAKGYWRDMKQPPDWCLLCNTIKQCYIFNKQTGEFHKIPQEYSETADKGT